MSNLRFGEFTLNLRLRELRRQETVLPVSGKAFDLLVFMASNAGRPLSKAELLDAVWPELAVEESNLSQNVFLLRKVLGSGPDGPIKTLAGRGYQFAAEVVEVPAAMPEGLPSEVEEPTQAEFQDLTIEATQTRVVVRHDIESRLSLRPSRRVKVAGAVALVAALGAGGWFGWEYWQDRTGGDPVKVVLTNLEGTTGDAILDRSLTDAMRIDLVQSPFVTVVSGGIVRATLAQMTHKPDEVMSAATAREVCERTNSQAVLSGNVARVGQHFLLTAQATSCADGAVLAETKREADTAEDLPHSIDKLAANLRQKLGESRRSIARFSAPLFPMKTVSLEALKEYSQASQLSAQGKWTDAIPLLKQAIAADPNFATAYYDLAGAYISQGDMGNGRTILQKAYAVRENATEPVRFAINALYSEFSTEDLYEAERNDRNWLQRYPNSVQAWNLMSIVQRELGHHAAAAEASRHTVALAPTNQGAYLNYAYNQMRAGDLNGAKATCDLAIAHHLDGDRIRNTLLDLAVLRGDSALLAATEAWGEAHPEAGFLRVNEVEMAIGQGRFADALRLQAVVVAEERRQGLGDLANHLNQAEGLNLFEVGDEEAGARLFHSAPMDPEDGDELIGVADMGDAKTALAVLATMRQKYPQGTLWNQYFGPRIEATVALANHKPEEAVKLMEATRSLDSYGLDHQRFRGDAYMAAGQPALAEKEYRAVTTRHEIDPLLGDYPMAWLGLGRALAGEGKKAEAADAYRHFLTLWAHADPNAIHLIEGKRELAELLKTAATEKVQAAHGF